MDRVKSSFELLIFPLSFALNRVVRSGFRLLYRLRFLLQRKQFEIGPFSWQTLNEVLSEKPFFVRYLAVAAPRWNPHALIASGGPVRVDEKLEFSTSGLCQAAAHWYFVIYRAPNSETIHCVSSEDDPQGNVCLTVDPGIYTVTLRAYLPQAQLCLPDIVVDGGERRIAARTVASREQPELEGILFHRRSPFFGFLHHYMRTMLRRPELFPGRWVEREYLPVGNPETRFVYGAFEAGQSIRVSADERVLGAGLVYLTCYNRSSFPVYGVRVEASPEVTTPSFSDSGFYLCRIVLSERIPDLEDRLMVTSV